MKIVWCRLGLHCFHVVGFTSCSYTHSRHLRVHVCCLCPKTRMTIAEDYLEFSVRSIKEGEKPFLPAKTEDEADALDRKLKERLGWPPLV